MDDLIKAEPASTDPLDAKKLEDGIGFCLSGGGFRAMVFHLGALWRLNELGLLQRIARFSSVSGGSITNGVLALAWRDLNFGGSGAAANFADLVAKPILAFARTRVDVGAILLGLIPGLSASGRVAAAYDKALFHGATLRDLPPQPRFNFNATNLMSAGLMRISQDYVADYRIGQIVKPSFRLADVVAASSAFPPVLSPLDLDFGDQPMVSWPGAPLGKEPYTRRAVLTDGGVYDNLGLESVWKRYRTVLASNAGRNVDAEENPAHSWPLQLNRVVNVMYNQVDNARERQLLALARAKVRTVGYWTIQTDPGKFPVRSPLSLSPAELLQSATISTRLSTLSAAECTLLVRHGYLLSDLAVRNHVDTTLSAPSAFPVLTNYL
ncbi:MAG TPA: patatin-like phospholipase family protein [Rhizomicrobium sp.]|jgi:NTE family protein